MGNKPASKYDFDQNFNSKEYARQASSGSLDDIGMTDGAEDWIVRNLNLKVDSARTTKVQVWNGSNEMSSFFEGQTDARPSIFEACE